MSLKMKLTASISAFFLVVGLMLIGIMAVNQATVNMGGSISFTATDVYAHVTGSIANDTSNPSNLDVTYSAEETTGDPTVWNDLNLAFDSQATPIEVTITVENLSAQNTLRVNLNDKLSSTIENFEKVVQNDGETYTNHTDITLQPNGQENDSTTFTITMSVKDKNTSLTTDFDYELNLFDQYYVPQSYEYFTFAENGDGSVELTAFDEDLAPSTNLVIPKSVSLIDGVWMEGDTYTVTDILSATSSSNGVFYNSGITSIEFPSTLKTIGDYAFFGCSGLTEVDLSNCTSLTSIGSKAFYNCSGLTGELNLGECTSLTSIGYSAFYNCSGLTRITLPSSLETIGDYAFWACTNLQPSATDSQGVKHLGNSENPYLVLWDGTDITTSTYTVNEKCKIIYDSAFSDCSGLTSITLPSSLTSIGYFAFRACSGLTEVDLSNCTSLTSIGNSAFWGCSGLTRITLPSSLTSIGISAFYDCSGLTSIDLSNCTSLTSIGDHAFFGCSGLTGELIIPEGVTSIGNGAFSDCSGLTGELIIPEGVTSIEKRAFYGCSGLKSITLPSSLEAIRDYAFDGCGGLKSIDLSNCTSLTSIGDHAFAGCIGLTSITLPSSLTSIGDFAFEDCTRLTSITLPSSLTSIGNSAFYWCTGLTSATINQYVFGNVTSSASSCGYILSYIGSGETVLVPANLIDELHLTNSYLDDESEFTRSATANEDGYYVYTKI